MTSIASSAEIIDLSDDDDDDDIICDSIRQTSNTNLKRKYKCLNPDCRSEKDLMKADEAVRRYYGVLSYPKKRRVCVACSVKGKMQENSLLDCLTEKKLILAEELGPLRDTVCLTDSDTDPSDGSASSVSEYEIDPNEFSDVEFEDGFDLTRVIQDTIKKLELENQITGGIAHLKERLLKAEEGFNALNEEYDQIGATIDMIRKNFYDAFRPDIKFLPSIEIGPPGMRPFEEKVPPDAFDVIAESEVRSATVNLPPVGPLSRPPLKVRDQVYSVKNTIYNRWIEAEISEISKDTCQCKIRYTRGSKSVGFSKMVSCKNIAYWDQSLTRVLVGTRVIARYRDEDAKNACQSGSFYVGIVAEIPTAANRYRYLIFFDDGYAQYVTHSNIRVVVESSSCVWEDVAPDSREFIKEYLQMYPERPMVRLQKWNYVKTEWDGKWWKAQVLEVDGSLVKMHFPLDKRTEWIYRGSTRLGPLFNKKMNLQAQSAQPNKSIRRRTIATGKEGPVVEYGTFGQDSQEEEEEEAQQESRESSSQNQNEVPPPPFAQIDASLDEMQREQKRAVARKSTTGRAGTPPPEVQKKIVLEAKGNMRTISISKSLPKFHRHQCGPSCLLAPDDINRFKGWSPLLYPLLFGWRRQIVKQRKKTICHQHVYYVAPCGRRLRSIDDVKRFLRLSQSNLEVDCFTYNVRTNVCNEWEPGSKIYYNMDFTAGKENVQISAVNCLEDSCPAEMVYSQLRHPIENVFLNLDPGFLVGCECTDNCQNKEKCPCWNLTRDGITMFRGGKENTDFGYKNKRLLEPVLSGIYECNSRCKCKSTCLNRVVQQPLRLELQLFKTARRGWGVRCLHDIPHGTFICVYVGKILSEDFANEDGQITGGDVYYAELDYIEVMEKAKEDYEDDVVSDEELGLHKPSAEKKAVEKTLNSHRLDDFDYSVESDGSISDADNVGKTDKSYIASHGHLISASGVPREKSARILDRQSKRGSVDSQDSSSVDCNPDTDSSGKNSENVNDEDDDEENRDVPHRQRQNFAALASLLSTKSNESVRRLFGKNETVYIMDAKHTGNIGRYLNHSCQPNVFVQNVFVDTHDLRFPWVAFFANCDIQAGTELTWDYNYEVGSVPGKVKYCYCGERKCRGRLL